MLTYHNNPAVKAARINRHKQHIEADRLVKGTYGNAEHRGCSVGCDAMDITGYVCVYPHAIVAEHDGIPEWIEHLRDAIFEGLPIEDAITFHLDIAEAIPVGVDLTRTYHRLMAWLLGDDSPAADGNNHPSVADAFAGVRKLHERAIAGDTPTDDVWSAAGSAARAAAWSATWSRIAAKLLELLRLEIDVDGVRYE